MTSENTLEITPEPIQLHLASELSTYISSQLNNSLYLVPALGITAPESIITEDVIWTSGDADLNIELSPIFETDENLLGCQFPPVRTDTRTVTLGNEDSILGCIASLDLDADEKIKRTVGALSMALELPSSRQFTAADSPRGLFSIDQDGSWTMRGWPPAVPRLGPQIRTTPDMARMIRALLVDYVHDDTLHRRIQIALEYIEAGWKPLGRLGFLHNAIAIDALFGIQGQVRISIENGLAHYASEVNNIHRRANLLWRLRNELTHGASQRLELSPVYLTYYDEFGVDPALDQINILRTCLWNLAEAI